MQEFEELDYIYQERLREISSAADNIEACNKKIAVLESYVADLKDLNRMLVQVCSELELETRNRVEAVEKFLQRTANSAKTYMIELNQNEQYIRNLVKDKVDALVLVQNLQEKCACLVEEKLSLEDHNGNLNHDIGSLVRLIAHARNTGHWDIGNIEFCEVSFEEVFGSVDRFSNQMSIEELSVLDNGSLSGVLSNGLTEDCGFRPLCNDRSASLCSQTSLQTLSVSSGGRLTKKDAQIFKLQVDLRQSQQQMSDIQNQLSERDRTIAQLQVQITDLNHEISLKDSECYLHSHTLDQSGLGSKRATYDGSIPLRTQRSECDTKTDLNDKPFIARENSCDKVVSPKEELKSILLSLQHDNKRLTADLTSHENLLKEREDELSEAKATCVRLEQELSITENLWQELETYKEDKERLIEKLNQKREKLRELKSRLKIQTCEKKDVETRGVGQRAATVCDVSALVETEDRNAELCRLKGLEERHRLKAFGLEVVIQQLEQQISESRSREDLLREEIRQLKAMRDAEMQKSANVIHVDNSIQVSELQESVSSLKEELQTALSVIRTKDTEIERQLQTICNLQNAVVNLKRYPSKNLSIVSNGNDTHGAVGTSSRGMSRTQSKSSDIFDI